MKAKDRDEQLFRSAAELAASGECYLTLTREQIAARAKCAPTLVSYRFKTMERFRVDLMRWAIRDKWLVIIAQGLAHGDKYAKRAPWYVQAQAKELL